VTMMTVALIVTVTKWVPGVVWVMAVHD